MSWGPTKTTSLLALACAAVFAGAAQSEELLIEVRETRGLRRNTYPTAVLVDLPQAVPQDTAFRLSADEKPLRAQFRPATSGTSVSKWWIDFQIDMAPFEMRRCRLNYGDGVKSIAEPAAGHELRETDDAFVIVNAPHISWQVPRDLAGLLGSVNFRPHEFLRPNSAGLVARDRTGKEHRFGGSAVQAQVVRSGRLAVGLHFAGSLDDSAAEGVKWSVDLTFPVRVSWVEVDLRVEDPGARLASVAAALNLALDSPTSNEPTLVDAGVGTSLYATLRNGESARLVAAGQRETSDQVPWRFVHGKLNDWTVLAEGQSGDLPTEGWAHLMDRKKCLAVAVHEFGKQGQDRIELAANGAVRIERDLALQGAPIANQRLRFWLHFVGYPPQQTAATSPQMMQTPLEVRVLTMKPKR